MNELNDEYLWSGEGTPSEDVASLERSLGVLRWQPAAVPLPSDAEVIPLRREPTSREGAKWWPTVIAGLVAAAAVFGVLVWGAGSKPEIERQPSPTVEPTAPPSSPDLKDPFGPPEPRGFTAPITDPEPAPTSSPDLKDPFADRAEPEPRPRKPKRPDSSSDLKDPFGKSRREDRVPAGDLVDPFGARDDSPPSSSSGDLKDPFSKLDAEAEAGEDR